MSDPIAEWHAWRLQGIGSSDAPIIMGVSPWMTPYQLWEEKTGRTARNQEGNWATQRGNRLEPMARAHFEMTIGYDCPATLVTHPIYPWVRSSLDGLNRHHKMILEIKNPGAEDHAIAVAGGVPEKYKPQIQHQLMAATQLVADEVAYYSFDGKAGVIVYVGHDLEYQEKLFSAEHAFWMLVQCDAPPPLTDRDYKRVKLSKEMGIKLDSLAAWRLREKEAQRAAKEIEKEILAEVENRNVRMGDWRIAVVNRKGSVDYRAVPELSGVNLDLYRKPSVSYRTISRKDALDDI